MHPPRVQRPPRLYILSSGSSPLTTLASDFDCPYFLSAKDFCREVPDAAAASALDDVELAPEEVDGATELELDGAAELELTVAAVVLPTLLMTVEEAEDNDRSKESEN
ncbi:hypothetical protein FIBSPDRAFT_1039020 [Athelia psychrophila]|uniref:Uncharacterized protein n=1 Tax=Athelia psychrophila TaxID=1759441 RepID=A0A166SF13_9AGAM|nr:hypothetical protein FIBSPDRAFT_1039020 [Fibularhizoctonia sp. CBS 109695]